MASMHRSLSEQQSQRLTSFNMLNFFDHMHGSTAGPPDSPPHMWPAAAAAAAPVDRISMLGLKVPRSALADKTGSVAATLAVYTIYPPLVGLLLSLAVYWDMRATRADWSPAMEYAFLGTSVAAAALWSAQGYLLCMAPSGIPAFLYFQVHVPRPALQPDHDVAGKGCECVLFGHAAHVHGTISFMIPTVPFATVRLLHPMCTLTTVVLQCLALQTAGKTAGACTLLALTNA